MDDKNARRPIALNPYLENLSNRSLGLLMDSIELIEDFDEEDSDWHSNIEWQRDVRILSEYVDQQTATYTVCTHARCEDVANIIKRLNPHFNLQAISKKFARMNGGLYASDFSREEKLAADIATKGMLMLRFGHTAFGAGPAAKSLTSLTNLVWKGIVDHELWDGRMNLPLVIDRIQNLQVPRLRVT